MKKPNRTHLMTSTPTTDELRNALEDALRGWSRVEGSLTEDGVGERALVHRLAVHFELAWKFGDGRHFDCEYNRHGFETKRLLDVVEPRLQAKGIAREDATGRELSLAELVTPDFVVHVRGTDASNLLAVEAKVTLKSDQRARNERMLDLVKLRALKEVLGYRLTAFVTFDPLAIWFDPQGDDVTLESASWTLAAP